MKRILIVWFLCVWTVLPSWAQTYKYEEIYQELAKKRQNLDK